MPRSSRRHGASLVLLAIPLFACGEGAGTSHDDPVESIALGAPAVRYGSLDGRDALVPVGDLTMNSDGGVWATQAQDGSVLAIDAAGERRLAVGGLGEGPGEFSAVSGLGRLGDTLWINDRQARRTTFYTRTGELLGTAPFPEAVPPGVDPSGEGPSPLSVTFHGPTRGGAIHDTGPGATELMDPASPLAGDDPILLTPPAGGDTRVVALRSGTRPQAILARRSNGQIAAISIYRQPFSDGSLTALDERGDGLVVVDRPVLPAGSAHRYRVTRIGTTGDTVWSVERAYEPMPADVAKQDSIVQAMAEQAESEELVRDRLFLPPTMPPARAVFVGLDGRVWVARERADRMQPARWDLFAADGRLEAEVTVPGGVELEAADAAGVWGVETDELDVPYLVRFELSGGPGLD